MIGAVLGLVVICILLSYISNLASTVSYPLNVTVVTDEYGSSKKLDHQAPIILDLTIEGVIGKGYLVPSNIETILRKIQEEEFAKNRVKAILLTIHSPGGESFETDRIYRLLSEYKHQTGIPIFAYINGLCTSGGYYIACVGDQIFSSSSSLIGSIGVISWPPYFNVHELLEKHGVKAKTIFAGSHKDSLNPTRAWQLDETQQNQQMIDFLYERFVQVVCDARHLLTPEKVHQDGAAVFNPIAALNNGYIDDADANRCSVLHALAVRAGIAGSYQVIRFNQRSWWKKWSLNQLADRSASFYYQTS